MSSLEENTENRWKKDRPADPLSSSMRGNRTSVDSGLHLASSDLNYQLISSQPGAVLLPTRETFGNPKGCFWRHSDEGGGCWNLMLRSQGCQMTRQRHANEPPEETPPGWPNPKGTNCVSTPVLPQTGLLQTGQPKVMEGIKKQGKG